MITRIFYSKSPADTINYVMNSKKQAEVTLSKGINSMLFPDYTPVISSGGGGGNKSDEDEEKKKKKRRTTGRGCFSKR